MAKNKNRASKKINQKKVSCDPPSVLIDADAKFPNLKWAQNSDHLIITIEQSDIENVVMDVNETTNILSFTAQSKNTGQKYGFALEMLEKVNNKESLCETEGRNVILKISKFHKDKHWFWPRITKEKTKNQKIAIDWDLWVDPEDEPEVMKDEEERKEGKAYETQNPGIRINQTMAQPYSMDFFAAQGMAIKMDGDLKTKMYGKIQNEEKMDSQPLDRFTLHQELKKLLSKNPFDHFEQNESNKKNRNYQAWVKLGPLDLDKLVDEGKLIVDQNNQIYYASGKPGGWTYKNGTKTYQSDHFGLWDFEFGWYEGQVVKKVNHIVDHERQFQENGVGVKHNQNSVYEGQMFQGKYNGYGRQIHANGQYYEGYWKDFKHHGKGKKVDFERNKDFNETGFMIVKEGQWDKGKFIGGKEYKIKKDQQKSQDLDQMMNEESQISAQSLAQPQNSDGYQQKGPTFF